MKNWEDFITLNSDAEPFFRVLSPASHHQIADGRKHLWDKLDYQEALRRDTYPLPNPEDREGYYGQDHFSYWASGLRDARMLLEAAEKYSVPVSSYLDLGCASGRVVRHFAVQYPQIHTYGCDINRSHVLWCCENLPDNCVVFQNHAVPSIPLPDASVDLISAFSVLTHVESMETAWLMEFLRLLRPGGIAWLTVHTERTLHDMDASWPLWKAVMNHPQSRSLLDQDRNFEGNRLVLRWRSDSSYSANVFYRESYIRRVWGRYCEILDIRHRYPQYQDVVLIRKATS